MAGYDFQVGVVNGDFRQGPGDDAVAINDDDNPLPGWSYVAATGTATVIAYGRLTFQSTAGAYDGYIEQLVPLPLAGHGAVCYYQASVDVLLAAVAITVDTRIDLDLLDEDGAVVVASTSATVARTGSDQTIQYSGLLATVTDTVATARVRVRLTTPSALSDEVVFQTVRLYEGVPKQLVGKQGTDYAQGPSADTPPANHVVLYAKADGLMYSKAPSGTETLVSSGTQATPSGPRFVLTPAWFGAINLTTATALVSNTSYAVYLGRAISANPSVTVQCEVATATATITWAEVAICTGTPANSADLTRRGSTDVSGTFNSTGNKSTSVTTTGIAIGDDLWAVFGSQATTPFQLRAGLANPINTRAFQSVAATRPSTMASPTTFSRGLVALAVPRIEAQLG